MKTISRRQKHFLIIASVLCFVFGFIPQNILNENELIYLFVVVLPLGLYMALDPEQRRFE